MPKASPKKAALLWAMRDEEWPSVKRPDLDNIVKAVTDGMNGVVYQDDVQVAQCRAFKVLVGPDDNERVHICVAPFKKERLT